jgi:hypothetical protein
MLESDNRYFIPKSNSRNSNLSIQWSSQQLGRMPTSPLSGLGGTGYGELVMENSNMNLHNPSFSTALGEPKNLDGLLFPENLRSFTSMKKFLQKK